MAPKKAVPVSEGEVPAAAETKTNESKDQKDPKPTKLKTLSHPSTLSMVVEVLKKNTEKKGTSVQAIRNKILATHPTVDPIKLKTLLKKALNKGIEKGVLIRPSNSSATGATGRFKLAQPLPKTKDRSRSSTSENVDPNVQSKEKPKKKAAKKAKSTETTDEKPGTASKKEKSSDEKPKASKTKKDEEKKKSPAETKKPKAETSEAGITKAKKGPAKKEPKAETEKDTTKAVKDSDDNPATKPSKKGKK